MHFRYNHISYKNGLFEFLLHLPYTVYCEFLYMSKLYTLVLPSNSPCDDIQGASSDQVPVMTPYPSRQPFLPQWPGQGIYPPTGATSVEENQQLQFMYQQFLHANMHGNSQTTQTLGNYPRMMNPGLMNFDYSVANSLPRNVPLQGLSSENQNNMPGSSRLSGSFGREGSTSASGGHGYTATTQASASRPQKVPNSTTPNQNTNQPFFFSQSAHGWPGWGGASTMSPFSFPLSAGQHAIADPRAVGDDVGRLPMPCNGEHDRTLVVNPGESKKTAQRRIQRERQRAYKIASQVWPMKIAATDEGELPVDVRAAVHTQIRASSRRFLDLSVIKFRDHPDSDIQILKDDLDRRFVFDPPLREGYVLFYVESSLRTARYIWHKHWLDTGRGAKHKWCPTRFFPTLVRYWRTKEADEEARVLKAEREAKRKERDLRMANGVTEDGNTKEEFDVSQNIISCTSPCHILFVITTQLHNTQ